MMAVVRSTTTATETYHGYVETTDDALRILEACRRGTLKRRSRRLCESERTNISSGSLFVWDESESGIRRWTDGKRWSPSRVNGCFLVYTELHPRPSSSRTSDIPLENGLVKKALSLFTNTTSKLHLVCYFRKEDVDKGRLKTPAEDPLLCNIKIPRSLYPDIIPEMSQTPDRSNSGGSSLAPFSLHRERRVSVAVAPIPASRGSSKPLPYLQTNDCQLVASTQPHFAHPDRDASSAQWSPSLLQQLQQQQQAALDHTESCLSYDEYKSPPATATKGLAITMDNSQQGIRLPDVDLQVRSLSHQLHSSLPIPGQNRTSPIVSGQGSDPQQPPPPMGWSYANVPASRRNTVVGNGRDAQSQGADIKLPPISELLRSINAEKPPSSLLPQPGRAAVAAAALTASSSQSSAETAVGDARAKYGGHPWQRSANFSVGGGGGSLTPAYRKHFRHGKGYEAVSTIDADTSQVPSIYGRTSPMFVANLPLQSYSIR